MKYHFKPMRSRPGQFLGPVVWAVILSPVLLLLSAISAPVTAASSQSAAVRIGPFYPDAPNGITFIVDHKAAFLLRVGWVQNAILSGKNTRRKLTKI